MKYAYRQVITLSGIVILIACGGGGGPSGKSDSGFNEGWESATIGSYSPAVDIPVIVADEGSWIVGDTVSSFPDCGPTPKSAEIISVGGGKVLRLISQDSASSSRMMSGSA